MDAKRFAELVHSLHEAGQIALGARKQSRGKANPHVGSDFEDFLAEEGWLPVTNVPLLEIEQLCEQVVGFFEGDVAKTALWFRLPNPLLGDVSPRDMIRCGRYARLQQFVTDALADNAVAAEQQQAFAIKVPNRETRAAMEEARAMTRARFTNAGR